MIRHSHSRRDSNQDACRQHEAMSADWSEIRDPRCRVLISFAEQMKELIESRKDRRDGKCQVQNRVRSVGWTATLGCTGGAAEVCRYNQRVFRVIRLVVSNEDEADDILQDAWVRAYEHLNQF